MYSKERAVAIAKNDIRFHNHKNIHTKRGLFNCIKKKKTRVK